MANANQTKIEKIDEAIVLLYGDGSPSQENLEKIKILADERKSLSLEERPEYKPNWKDKALAGLGIENIQKTDQGQNVVNFGNYPGPGISSSPGTQLALKTGSNLARGVGSLPFDLYGKTGLPGSEGSLDIADSIRKTIPVFKGGAYGTDAAATIAQYAIPGMAAFKAAQFANAPRFANYASGLLGSAASDFAVTIPGETTSLGDLIGGPTAIKPTDDPVDQRFKVGSEVLGIGPVVDTALSPFRFIGSKLPTQKNIQRDIPTVFQKPGNIFLDPEKAASELETVVNRSEIPGFKPTTGTSSLDTMGVATERGVASQPELVNRRVENVGAISDEARNISSSTGDIADTANTVEKARLANIRAAESNVLKNEQNYEVAQKELDSQIAKINNSTRASQESASKTLDDQLQNELLVLNKQKKDLYDAIDPTGTLEVDLTLLKKSADFIRKPKAPLKTAEVEAVKEYGSKIFKAIDTAIDLQNKGDKTSYKDLIGLRANVNDAIGNAYSNNSTVAAKNLENIRSTIDQYTENLSNFNQGQNIIPEGFVSVPSDAAEAAVKANNFYKNIYAPKFKEGLGAKWADNTIKKKNLETQTAQNFLLGPTEGATQLRNIINNAQNPKIMEKKVRQFMIGELAQRAFKGKSEVAPQQILQFIKQYDSILNQFPDLKTEISLLRSTLRQKADKTTGLAKAVISAKNNLKQTEANAGKSAFKYFTGYLPEDAVSRILSSPNPTRALTDLRRIIGNDKAAKLGLKAGLRDELYNRIINTKGVTNSGDEINVASLAKLNKLLTQERMQNVLKGIFNKTEMAALNRVRQRVTELDRINIQTTTGSSTNPLKQDTSRVKTILASYYGIVTGRGVFYISDYIGDVIRGDRARVAAEKILTKAMLDPEFALIMLKADTRKNQLAARTYILNNFPEAFDPLNNFPEVFDPDNPQNNPENNVAPTSPEFSLDTRPDVTPQEFLRNQVPY
tara:strand:+ start:1001 stop:3904 length:2904 start_codon:yes stop_codon:yes gene_type:complete